MDSKHGFDRRRGSLHPDKKTLNVEYIADPERKHYRKGPITLPFKGFDLN